MAKRVILGLVRAVVFIAGMLAGLYSAAIVLFNFGSAAINFVGIFGGLGLLVAAPICWVMAVRSPKGDLWTLAYLGAWALMMLSVMVIGVVERGKSIRTSNNAVLVALFALAVLYGVVVPVAVHFHRRRLSASGD